MSRPTNFWTFPIETVSQSEGGFELVHQSVVVMPHWLVEADKEGRWSVTMQMSLDTSRAENRNNHHEEAVAVPRLRVGQTFLSAALTKTRWAGQLNCRLFDLLDRIAFSTHFGRLEKKR